MRSLTLALLIVVMLPVVAAAQASDKDNVVIKGHPAADLKSYTQYEDVLDRIEVYQAELRRLRNEAEQEAIRDSQASVDNQVLASISLDSPELQSDRDCLGIGSQAGLRLPEIKADTLIISIFNTYCGICQQDVLFLNELYRMVQEDDLLKRKIKFIGIAVGNNLVEVSEFRKANRIEYPLFADFGFTIGKAFSGNLRTPVCLITRITSGRRLKVLHLHTGQMTERGFRTVQHLLENREES